MLVKKKYLALFITAMCSFAVANSQTVDFSFSTSNGNYCAPQVVSFTQNCTGNPDGFIWSFGNGQTSTSATPNITFITPGTYNVTLTATFASQALSITKTITINSLPQVLVTVDRNYICQPGTINFTAIGSSNITNYAWQWNDGTPIQNTNSNIVPHQFTNNGAYNVQVIATTQNGCAATAAIAIEVKPIPLILNISPNSGCIPIISTLSVNATLPQSDFITNYNWNFGDGQTQSSVVNNVAHNYTTTNAITTASVTVTSNEGCTNSATFAPFAFGTPPFNIVANTTAQRDTFCGSETIEFIATATNALLYRWDFGDGTIETVNTNTIVHKFITLGNKQIIVTPIFNGCNGQSDTVNIVLEGVIARYNFSNTCNNKNTFQFVNSSSGNVSKYYWTFSDNNAIKDSINYNIEHIFPNIGTHTTKLYVYDNVTGCNDSLITNQYTAVPEFTADTNKVCRDSSILYTVSNSYNPASGFVYKYHVNGSIYNASTQATLTTFPDTFGVFNNYVVIINPNGNTCNDTVYMSSTVTVGGPNLRFSTITQQCLSNAFPINNTSAPFFIADTIVNWKWDFGDGTIDSVRNPNPKYYNGGGNYTITLTAADINNCKQTYAVAVNPLSIPFIKVFPKQDTICFGATTMLSAFATDTLIWTPSSGLSCNNCDTTFANPAITTLYIATATNNFGCSIADSSLIKVAQPINLPPLLFDTTVCVNKSVPIRLNYDGYYTWLPATYLSATNISNPIAVPDSSIRYQVIVRDSVGCFADTSIVQIDTYAPPRVNAGNDLLLPYNSMFTLAPNYTGPISTYNWSPTSTNNLNCASCPNANGIALVSDSYKIEVTTVNGCVATDSIKVEVICNEANLYLPTAFTPNNDGVNDYFYPMARGYKNINVFKIWNRYGQLIFERKNFQPNNANLGWDGFFRGQKLANTQGLVWYIEATCDTNQTITKKGTIVLIN